MKNPWLGGVVALMSLSGAISGCGGGSSGAALSCGKVEPCGGSVVGRWKVATSCFDDSTILATCPQAKYDGSGLTVSGTATYGADMTYSAMVSLSGFIVLTLPPGCLTSSGMTLTCDELNQAIQSDLQNNPDPTIQSETCTAVGANCQCKTIVAPKSQAESGTYSLAGTQITTTPSGSATSSSDDYCVQAKQLHVVSVDTTMNMGPMGQATITADIVLTSQ